MRNWIGKIRTEIRPLASAGMSFLTAALGFQLILSLILLAPVGRDDDMRDSLVRLAGEGLFFEKSHWPQAILGLCLVAFVCSCGRDWGLWTFRRGDTESSWAYPFEVRLVGALLNAFYLISVMHAIGLAAGFMGPVRIWAMLYAVVVLLYVFSAVGTCPMGISFLLDFTKELSILVAFVSCWWSGSVMCGVGSAVLAVAFCYVLDAGEPFLMERWDVAFHRALEWLGISIEEA